MIEIITGNAWQIVQKPEQLGTAFCANMTTVRTIAHAMKHARNRDAEYVWDTQTEIGIVVGIRRMKKLVKTASEMARLLEPQRTPSNIQGRFRIHPSFSHFYRGEYNLPASRKQLADKLRQACGNIVTSLRPKNEHFDLLEQGKWGAMESGVWNYYATTLTPPSSRRKLLVAALMRCSMKSSMDGLNAVRHGGAKATAKINRRKTNQKSYEYTN